MKKSYSIILLPIGSRRNLPFVNLCQSILSIYAYYNLYYTSGRSLPFPFCPRSSEIFALSNFWSVLTWPHTIISCKQCSSTKTFVICVVPLFYSGQLVMQSTCSLRSVMADLEEARYAAKEAEVAADALLLRLPQS